MTPSSNPAVFSKSNVLPIINCALKLATAVSSFANTVTLSNSFEYKVSRSKSMETILAPVFLITLTMDEAVD